MSKGKGIKSAGSPKKIEMKGPVSQVSKSKSFTKVPSMDNKNGGGSNVKTESSPSDRAASATTFPGFRGQAVDLHIKGENTKGHLRNSGSALRGGAGRNSSHDSGNRYGK